MRFLSVPMTRSGSWTRGRMAASMAVGEISGSSPWMLTIIPAVFHAFLERPHDQVRLVDQGQDSGVDGGGRDQRFVALDVDNNSGVFGGSHFGHPVRAGEVIGARHAHTRAETFCDAVHSLVIGSNDHAGEVSRQRGTFVHVL